MKNFFNTPIDLLTATKSVVLIFGLFAVSVIFSLSTKPELASAKAHNNTIPVTPTALYKGYMDGKLFMLITDSTRDEAAGNCLLNAVVNPGKSVLCNWGAEELYNLSYTDNRPKCNNDVDIKNNQKKSSSGGLLGSILIGTCDAISLVTTDVEFVDSLVSQIKLGSEADPLYGWTIPMLLESFPGLLESDFASIETTLVSPSISASVTSNGFRTLARNLSTRFGIPLESSTAVNSIITNIQTTP